MENTSRYWKICQISLSNRRSGYECRSLPVAEIFFHSQFSDASTARTSIQTTLLSQFQDQQSSLDSTQRAQAGLCLRCTVSYPILKACQKIDSLYSGDKQFTYHDLLPFVLHDDGKDLIILDTDGKTQVKVNPSGRQQPTAFKTFTVEVLRTFKAESPTSMSLDNWAFLQTKQCSDLKNFLSEFGFQHLSDWALLNRVRPKQIEQLAERDRLLVEAFHAVYRRDRRQQNDVGKCLDPSTAQLLEMGNKLEEHALFILTPADVLKALKQVAQQLRQHDIWSCRTSLEVQNDENGNYELRHDLPAHPSNEIDGEEQEFLQFLHDQLKIVLTSTIAQGIQTQIAQLQKSKRYAPFAEFFIHGLQLYYCKGLSLKDIGPQLGMSSWDQTRRILNPGELLSNVRRLAVQQLLELILEQAQSKGFASMPPEPNYLKTLMEQIEAFVDAEIFEDAVSELKAGKNRLMDSTYAQQLKNYIEQNA